ncbi:hypothetical protein OL599_13475, partial [Rhodovastum sp. RN2-1]|nr:hypothetical protein [Limobrevibacterium gyesilva]
MLFVTDFADQAVVLPLAVAIALSLWLAGWGRGALAWCAAIAATFAAVGALKLAVFAFGAPPVLPDLRSPSGHTAAAALVYGGLAALLAAQARWRARTLAIAALCAATIGAT